jgi:hypothetical protein
VPVKPSCIEPNMSANILRSPSVALMGPPRKVSVVFASCSMSVSVFETSSGQVSLKAPA